MPGRLVSTTPTRSPRRATSSVVRPPMRAARRPRTSSRRPSPGAPYVIDLAAGAARHLERARRRRAGDEQAVLGDERDELAERRLDRLLVAEDVDVIELDRREDRRARPVVQELRPLVEEGGVVLVALDDELGALRRAATTAGSSAARRRSRNDGIAPASCSTCASERRRRRLAVRARRRRPSACRSRNSSPSSDGNDSSGMLRSWRRQHLDVVLAADVADDDDVGRPSRGWRGPKPSNDGDALLGELRRHRRVDVLVGAAHVVAGRLEQARERPHAGAADADEMNLHFGTHSVEPGWNCGRELLHLHA